MNKQIITDSITGMSYTKVCHSSGLTIMVMEMPEFTTSYAAFGTRYGSVNTTFLSDGKTVTDPLGIAHFLEHKLFENEDCDAFEKYAKTGANANAYTSFDRTVYIFDCSSNFNESLEILLDFVQSPYFTEKSVAKEQGIIDQEILMCEDSPFRKVYFNLLKAAYENHPVKYEIAGTVESIKEITSDTLYRAYREFYTLSNMTLCCAGNCKLDEILEICDRLLKPTGVAAPEFISPAEPIHPAQKEITQHMPVGLPMFSIGYKCKPTTGEDLIRKEYYSGFLMDLIFGQTSRFYNEYTRKGLINSHFEFETTSGEGYFINIINGESKEPKKVLELMNEEIARVKREGLDESQFEALKKMIYGNQIRGMNSVSSCASMLLEGFMRGLDAFAPSEILKSITFREVCDSIDELLNPEYCTISIIEQ